MIMKHFIYIVISFVIPLSAWAKNNVAPPSEGLALVGDQFAACVESENATGNGPVTSDPNASNGSTRGDENNYDHFVDYAVDGVQTTGTHQLTVRYYAGDAAQASISVNGNIAIPSADFPATHSWNIVWREETFSVMLYQGNNVIRIQGLPGNSIRQDKICVTGPGSGQPPCSFEIAPTSNAPIYDRSKPMSFTANCTGDCEGVTYAWAGNDISATGETISLTSPANTGYYTYYVTASKPGCTAKTDSVAVRVDWGVAPCRYYFYPQLLSYNVTCSKPNVIYAQCPEYDCDNVTYTWNGPGLNNVTGQVVNLTTPGEIGEYVYVVTASKPGCETKTVEYTLRINSCPPPANVEFGMCVDAETQDGSGPITYDPNASGGATRGDENNYKHYVNYAINGVPADGMYRLSLQYAASSSPKISLSGNDGFIYYAVSIPATHTWNIVFREELFMIPLKAGNNVLRIEGAPGASIRQDRICINSLPPNARMASPELMSESPELKSKLNVFPNPSPGEFNTSFYLLENEARITVTDVGGRVWYDTKVKGKGPHEKKVRLGNAPTGIYIMQIKNSRTTDRKKVLITH